ncbi:MAG: DNA cytosine methyltransferase [Selenomonadaceae bacterium]
MSIFLLSFPPKAAKISPRGGVVFMRYRLGELFSGPGGLALGAINAKIECNDVSIVHEWANDKDRNTCDTYINNICKSNPESVICEDVRELDMESLPQVDALAFGFPCNDFSLVGEQKGFDGEYGPLYLYAAKALRIFHPKWFLAENVRGLSSANKGGALPRILSDFHSAGYRVYPHLYKFEEYGVPQTRHRIIIVGIRDDCECEYRPPSPDDDEFKSADVSARGALENPPIPQNAPNNELTRQSEIVKKRLSYIKPGENAFNADIPPEYQLHVKGAWISQIYRRLDPDKPSYTVTGSGGGGTHIYHWSEPRALTNRERARLQTFPDDFVFYGNKESVRRQIGMAVPVKGSKVIFEAILRTMAGIPYKSVPCNIRFDNDMDVLPVEIGKFEVNRVERLRAVASK